MTNEMVQHQLRAFYYTHGLLLDTCSDSGMTSSETQACFEGLSHAVIMTVQQWRDHEIIDEAAAAVICEWSKDLYNDNWRKVVELVLGITIK